jgi:hypothetical protein
VFAGASGVYSQDNASLFFDNTNDRLGVGTASPSQKLTVQGGGANGTGGTRLLSDTLYANGANYEAYGRRQDANGSGGFAPGVLLARVNTAPAAITSDMNLGRVAFGGSYDGTDANVVYGAQIAGYSSGTYSASSAATDILFFTTPSGTAGGTTSGTANFGTERMRLDSSGNLLVGTSTNTIGTLVVKAKNTGYGGIQVVIQGGSDYWTQNVDTVSGYTWSKNGADFWHAGRSGSNNCVSVNGSWVNSSDERLKKNIKTLTSALEKITAMRGVEFDRKNNDAHEIGLIAQEVLLVYPEAVEKNGDFLGLNYGSLVGPLIEAIKELKAEFDAYKLLHP